MKSFPTPVMKLSLKKKKRKKKKVKALKKKKKKKPFFPQETSITVVFSLRTFLYLSREITAVSGNASAQTRGLGFGGLKRDVNHSCF